MGCSIRCFSGSINPIKKLDLQFNFDRTLFLGMPAAYLQLEFCHDEGWDHTTCSLLYNINNLTIEDYRPLPFPSLVRVE